MTPTFTVYAAPIVQVIVSLVAAALGILGSRVLYKLNQKFGLDISAGQQAAFDSALNKSLTYGATKATAAIAEHGWDDLHVHSAVVATALQQAVATFPEALAGVGLSTDMSDPKNNATLTAALERALPAAMAEVSASPSTPATPAATTPAVDPNAAPAATPVATIQIVTSPAK